MSVVGGFREGCGHHRLARAENTHQGTHLSVGPDSHDIYGTSQFDATSHPTADTRCHTHNTEETKYMDKFGCYAAHHHCDGGSMCRHQCWLSIEYAHRDTSPCVRNCRYPYWYYMKERACPTCWREASDVECIGIGIATTLHLGCMLGFGAI